MRYIIIKRIQVMVRANSLLYSIYVCLVVAVLCSGMLYMSGLYTQLNSYYMSRQDLYVYNESLVNFAINHLEDKDILPDADESGVQYYYNVKQYGAFPVVTAGTFMGNDTVVSSHLVGCGHKDNTALYIPERGLKTGYSGKVGFLGDVYVPDAYLTAALVVNTPASLNFNGVIKESEASLPKPIKSIGGVNRGDGVAAKNIYNVLKEGRLSNSFRNNPLYVSVSSRLSEVTVKGNVIISSPDSLSVSSSAHLEDVIIIAPKVSFEEGFEGSVQVFADYSITLGANAKLLYPSFLCINSDTEAITNIKLNPSSEIYGGIALLGSDYTRVHKNNIYIEENVKAVCDIYCTGDVSLKSDVQGSVYTNRVSYKTNVIHENVIANVTVGGAGRPGYFVAVPMMYKDKYEVVKKVI
ncbi:hypothetical protein ACLI08_16230 [Flavobacterium sp. RNTU_13]|uniref:hypothetical protein n=1 Tax=Flavobacterium sp. RNTU_13 TaxID=3375145 RepID=UPI0039861F6D